MPRQVYAVLAGALLLVYFQVLLPLPQPCQKISVLNLIVVRLEFLGCTLYSLSPKISDGFEMCIAHRTYLEYPAVLPFFCTLLNLSGSFTGTMGTIDDVVRTSFRSAFLCSLVFFETFVSDTGQERKRRVIRRELVVGCLDLTDFCAF